MMNKSGSNTSVAAPRNSWSSKTAGNPWGNSRPNLLPTPVMSEGVDMASELQFHKEFRNMVKTQIVSYLQFSSYFHRF